LQRRATREIRESHVFPFNCGELGTPPSVMAQILPGSRAGD
jgi:hypothetical protein